jgi:hypothetical protein
MGSLISKYVMKLLYFAPLMMILNAFWMVGNRQIFLNEFTLIDDETEVMPSGHFISYELQENWLCPL